MLKKDITAHYRLFSQDDLQIQFDNYEIDEKNQQISINDDADGNFLFDVENRTEHLWKINLEDDGQESIQWTDDQGERQITFSLENAQDKEQQWSRDCDRDESYRGTLLKHEMDRTNQKKTG